MTLGFHMARRIAFTFDAGRFVNSSAYVVGKCNEVTRMKLSKLLYFADKEHLLSVWQADHGRPLHQNGVWSSSVVRIQSDEA